MNPLNYSAISFPFLGIEVNPGRTFSIGPLTVHYYGMIIAIGLIVVAALLVAIDDVINTISDTENTADIIFADNRETSALNIRADYFPAYEIMMDELRDYRFYAEDMCHPSQQAVDYIGERFLSWALASEDQQALQENIRRFKRSRHIEMH